MGDNQQRQIGKYEQAAYDMAAGLVRLFITRSLDCAVAKMKEQDAMVKHDTTIAFLAGLAHEQAKVEMAHIGAGLINGMRVMGHLMDNADATGTVPDYQPLKDLMTHLIEQPAPEAEPNVDVIDLPQHPIQFT